ncbi:NAD(P)-dependent oxidoreductase [Saccharothrix obliqua]|uniref:NAD(P)-dependent oxidoreductase n=1 Tax=Saccharothrix obliqua TaxID=2861747 RepID=UPI001C5E2B55|nr:NAD(P)-dependent oxidoreductase [Saccharothrix obliqua]MBW4722012.1 hypothetical protein [Saccharothrix obliqua]
MSWDRPDVLVAHSKMAPALVPGIEAEVPVRRAESVADLAPAERAAVEVLVGYQFPAGVLGLLPNLRWVHLTGTGTDHLAAAGLTPGVLVTNSARVPVESVAEYAVAALFALLKDFAELPSRPPWYTSRAVMLDGSTVLVPGGGGRIGRAVIRRLSALGARCVAVTRDGRCPVPLAYRTVPAARLAEAAGDADHVVCCLPATPEPLLDKEVLAALPPHAALVNVGRASAVDEGALHDALRAGELRGAFLDVHRTEPLPATDPAWSVPNLVVSPHRAFAFPGEPAEVARTFLENLADLRAGRPARDAVAVTIDEGVS